MIIVERILLSILLIALILSGLNVGKANAILSISLLLIFHFYLFLSFLLLKPKGQRNTWKRILFSIFSGFFFAIGISGPVFRVNHWPGSGGTLLGGIVVLTAISVIAFSLYSKRQDSYFKRVYTRSFAIMLIAILFYSPFYKAFEKFRYREYPAVLEAIKNVHENPSDENYIKYDIEFMRMELSSVDFLIRLKEKSHIDSLYAKTFEEETAKAEQGQTE